MSSFVQDIWYFAGLSADVRTGALIRRVIAGEPITLGRKRDGSVFALRDICPHRAAPLSQGRIIENPTQKIKVRHFPVQENGSLIWVYIAADKRFAGRPPIEPPHFPMAARMPVMNDALTLNCHVDHAVIGLMDPAHGPYVHRQWWWRSEHSVHEKTKAFEPRDRGFAMAAHTPSSNSFAYKLLGGKPVTEITFRLPGIRTEDIKVGKKTLLSFTAVTPIDENHTEIRQIFFTDMTAKFATLPRLMRR